MLLKHIVIFAGSASQLTLFLSKGNTGTLDVSKGELIRRMSSMKDTTALLFNSDDNFHAGFHTNGLTYGLLICCVL